MNNTEIPALPEPAEVLLELSPYIRGQSNLYARAKQDCKDIAQLIIDATYANFASISNYMNQVVYTGLFKGKKRKELENTVNELVMSGTTSGWFIGKEFGRRSPELVSQCHSKDTIFNWDVPTDAQEALKLATYLAYYPFASIFTEYYDSPYGVRVSFQKEAHLKDTFSKTYSNAILPCFLKGVQSNDRRK
ncbi:MAG: hypothetical protein A2W35_10250 [Chloroflexi bacterium RBG_16_57_11]|nr:MAG: hypothetical protein A2W35_10250 [Chloroflexi bacterium RBG_16_57_11]